MSLSTLHQTLSNNDTTRSPDSLRCRYMKPDGSCDECKGSRYCVSPPKYRGSRSPDSQPAPLPMCETCDDPAMLLPNGEYGICQACIDFYNEVAANQTQGEGT